MSRGPGYVQQAILDALTGTSGQAPMADVTTIEVAHWLSDVRDYGDTEPTRAQRESARRALKRLERDGRLTSDWEPIGHPPGRWRVYRLRTRDGRRP
jgi:hypothetical protein